jgi:phospholipid transport system substrate-binding protein
MTKTKPLLKGTFLQSMFLKSTTMSLALAAAFVAASPAASAQGGAHAAAATRAGTPSRMVLDNSTRILTTLETRRAEFTKDRAALRQFVSSEFNAMFDRDYAARLVLGVHGRGASDADVKLFADALADSLMARYGSSLLDFNTKLKVRVKSETALPNGRGVRVSSEFLRQGGEPIPVDYLMRNTGTGWKVFDVMVEGVSFVQTFRGQFDGPLNRKSIAQVAADLKAGKLQADAGSN